MVPFAYGWSAVMRGRITDMTITGCVDTQARPVQTSSGLHEQIGYDRLATTPL